MTAADIDQIIRDAAFWLSADEERMARTIKGWPMERRMLGVVAVMHALESSEEAPRQDVLDVLSDKLTAARLMEKRAGSRGGAERRG